MIISESWGKTQKTDTSIARTVNFSSLSLYGYSPGVTTGERLRESGNSSLSVPAAIPERYVRPVENVTQYDTAVSVKEGFREFPP
jgi:hypothetical protein